MSKKNSIRLRTRDEQTFDQQTIDNAGAFLVGELERLDPTLHQPLVSTTWGRDIQVRSDVSIADEMSSFTNSSFSTPGQNGSGKSWVGKDANAITGMQLDIAKSAGPLTLWAKQLGWTLPELASAQQIGRPIDQQKFAGMQTAWQMDADEQVYIGDDVIGVSGLTNSPDVNQASATNGNWSVTSDPDTILADVDEVLMAAWEESGWAVAPSKLLLPPAKFGAIVQAKISTAGNQSVLEYLRTNNISSAQNNQPLDIQPVKWLNESAHPSGNNRMVAYTNDPQYVRFPMVPLQRTPVEFRDLRQLVTYYGRLGEVEVVNATTMAYRDGL